MNRSKLLLCVLCAVTVVMCAAFGGCKKSSETQLPPSGVLLEYNGCKQFTAGSQRAGALQTQRSDCFEFQYNGENTLRLRHINAGFNCCPGEITAEITFNGNIISITEIEQQQACRCLCLFDLDYEMINLPPGRYTIRVVEPYREENDQLMEFAVELSSANSGTFCLERTYYPWIQ
jgi:hypothetical protein